MLIALRACEARERVIQATTVQRIGDFTAYMNYTTQKSANVWHKKVECADGKIPQQTKKESNCSIFVGRKTWTQKCQEQYDFREFALGELQIEMDT